jgi:hypothetical protein
MIEEIDVYENKCVDSFDRGIAAYEKSRRKMLDEIKRFCDEQSTVLGKKNIDEKYLTNSLTVSCDYLKKLKEEDIELKTITFAGELLSFENNPIKRDQKLLGSLVYKRLDLNKSKIQQVNFKTIVPSCQKIDHVFKQQNGQTAVIYYDEKDHSTDAVIFNDDGVVVKHCSAINDYLEDVIKLGNRYVFFLNTDEEACYFFKFKGKKICIENDDVDYMPGCHILVTTDENFNYISHCFDMYLLELRGNKSNIAFTDEEDDFYLCDLNMNVINEKSTDEIRKQVGKKVKDFVMNDQHIFFLCDIGKLKIFDLKTFNLVKEMNTTADKLELVSTDHIFLFNSQTRMGSLFTQAGDFDEVSEFNFKSELDNTFKMSRDNSQFISFYSGTSIRYINLK